MIRKTFWSALIMTIVATLLLSMQALAAQEDTAQLTFTKTALAKKPLHTYTVQKGDMLSAIVRKIPGITEKEIPAYYKLIKELNPEVDSLDKLREGQEIVLPGKPVTSTPEKTVTQATDTSAVTPAQTSGQKSASTAPAGSAQNYQVKKGDTLIGIVHRELNVRSKTQPILLNIKALNPYLKDINKIHVGQVIRLPDGQTTVKVAESKIKPEEKSSRPVKTIEEDIQVIPAPEERKADAQPAIEGKDALILPPAQRLAVIKHIVTQMDGSMTTSGNYYLPVSKTEQLTIDCAIIPVVELEGHTIYLDQGDRSNAQLKKIISDRWNNHHLINVDPKDDIIVVLKKILKNTKSYEISKAQKPITAGSLPPLEIVVDWMIANKETKTAAASAIHGIRFVYEPNSLLPRAVLNHARKHSVFVTEISPEKGLTGRPEEIYSLTPLTVLPTAPAKDFAYALMTYLNISVEKEVDVRVFNIEKDGFNLSIKADLVLEQNGKKHIILSRNLPPQFANILLKEGNELTYISDQDPPAKTMETLLKALRLVAVSGYFSFSGIDKNQPPYSFGFNGTKIKTDKDLYVVNFNFSEDLRGLIKEAWSANIIRY